jgi:hypothetical protein
MLMLILIVFVFVMRFDDVDEMPERKGKKKRLDPNIIHAVVSEAPNANALSLSNNTTKENKIAMPCKPHAHNAKTQQTHNRSNEKRKKKLWWSWPDGRDFSEIHTPPKPRIPHRSPQVIKRDSDYLLLLLSIIQTLLILSIRR